jgi:hypothetical protein
MSGALYILELWLDGMNLLYSIGTLGYVRQPCGLPSGSSALRLRLQPIVPMNTYLSYIEYNNPAPLCVNLSVFIK